MPFLQGFISAVLLIIFANISSVAEVNICSFITFTQSNPDQLGVRQVFGDQMVLRQAGTS
jgi:hypothetical protein